MGKFTILDVYPVPGGQTRHNRMALVTQSEYAAMVGLSRQTIQARVKNGHIVVTNRRLPNGKIAIYIDTEKNPPEEQKEKLKPGKKTEN